MIIDFRGIGLNFGAWREEEVRIGVLLYEVRYVLDQILE